MTELLAARVPPWQAFRIRKFAQQQGQPLGLVLAEAIRVFLGQQNLPPEVIEAWLREYRETAEAVESGDAKVGGK